MEHNGLGMEHPGGAVITASSFGNVASCQKHGMAKSGVWVTRRSITRKQEKYLERAPGKTRDDTGSQKICPNSKDSKATQIHSLPRSNVYLYALWWPSVRHHPYDVLSGSLEMRCTIQPVVRLAIFWMTAARRLNAQRETALGMC